MASEELIKKFEAVADELSSVDLERALRNNLGDASIFDRLSVKIEDVLRRMNIISAVSLKIDNTSMELIISDLEKIREYLFSLLRLSVEEFVSQRISYIEIIEQAIDSFTRNLTPFLVYAQEELLKSSLSNEQVANTDAVKSYLRTASEEILERVRTEAENILGAAKEQATNIQTAARDTASGVSLINAQEQFGGLLKQFQMGMIIFGLMAATFFAVFIAYILILLNHEPNFTDIPAAIFSTAVRVTFLASIAAIVTFALKVFRSNLHMYYHTLHRQQLASSINNFVASARTEEQRDIIFGKLVEAVAAFGSSGLIEHSDDMPNTAKIIIDTLPKMLNAKTG